MTIFQAGKTFENRLSEENLKSKRLSWFMTAIFAMVCLGQASAIIRMVPLKRTEVKVIVVDKNTGLPTAMTSLADFETGNIRKIPTIEALNKFFVNQYIIAHDSYDHYAIRESYATVQLYSEEKVFREYALKFQPPINLDKELGKDNNIEINIISITPQDVVTPFRDGDGGFTMQARIEKALRSGDRIQKKTSGTVTITFGYNADLDMDERARTMNPLGFTVTSYRYDADIATEGVLQ